MVTPPVTAVPPSFRYGATAMHASSIHHKILTIPGLHNSGPTHWQSLWQQKFPDTRRVDLGDWDNPDQALWVARIADAIDAESAPVLIAAHSLGCHAFAHWFAEAGRSEEPTSELQSLMRIS